MRAVLCPPVEQHTPVADPRWQRAEHRRVLRQPLAQCIDGLVGRSGHEVGLSDSLGLAPAELFLLVVEERKIGVEETRGQCVDEPYREEAEDARDQGFSLLLLGFYLGSCRGEAKDDGTRPTRLCGDADNSQFEGTRRRLARKRLKLCVVAHHVRRAELAHARSSLAHCSVLKLKGEAGLVVRAAEHRHVDWKRVFALALEAVVSPRDVARVDDILDEAIPPVRKVACVRRRAVRHAGQHRLGRALASTKGRHPTPWPGKDDRLVDGNGQTVDARARRGKRVANAVNTPFRERRESVWARVWHHAPLPVVVLPDDIVSSEEEGRRRPLGVELELRGNGNPAAREALPHISLIVCCRRIARRRLRRLAAAWRRRARGGRDEPSRTEERKGGKTEEQAHGGKGALAARRRGRSSRGREGEGSSSTRSTLM
eukprot:scaffold17572_cov32-Tisochrysis_lutea.AAC.1